MLSAMGLLLLSLSVTLSDIVHVHRLNTVEDAVVFVGPEWRNRSVVVGMYGEHEKGKMMALWRAAKNSVHSKDIVEYGLITEPHIHRYFRTTAPSLVVFNPYVQQSVKWSKNTDNLRDSRATEQFININLSPLVGEFDGSRAQGGRLMSSSIKQMVIVVIEVGSPLGTAMQQEMRALAHDFYGKSHFLFASNKNKRVQSFFKLGQKMRRRQERERREAGIVSTTSQAATDAQQRQQQRIKRANANARGGGQGGGGQLSKVGTGGGELDPSEVGDLSKPLLVSMCLTVGCRPYIRDNVTEASQLKEFLVSHLGPPDRWKAIESIGKILMPKVAADNHDGKRQAGQRGPREGDRRDVVTE